MPTTQKTPTTGGGRARPAGRDAEKGGVRLEDRPRAELHDLAHRLEIAGYAEMSKAELIEAIRRR